MSKRVAELEGAELDYWVAKSIGAEPRIVEGRCHALTPGYENWWQPFLPSSSWFHGGPIIERERMDVEQMGAKDKWAKVLCIGPAFSVPACYFGPTLLIAAMRAFVASRFGDTVEDAQ